MDHSGPYWLSYASLKALLFDQGFALLGTWPVLDTKALTHHPILMDVECFPDVILQTAPSSGEKLSGVQTAPVKGIGFSGWMAPKGEHSGFKYHTLCLANNNDYHLHHLHLSLNCRGSWGTTEDFRTSFLHFSLFSTALWDLMNSRPVNSLIVVFPPLLLSPLSSSPFDCVLQNAFGQAWWMGDMCIPLQFASLYNIVRRSLCGPIAYWILAQTSSLVTWSFYEMRSILQ